MLKGMDHQLNIKFVKISPVNKLCYMISTVWRETLAGGYFGGEFGE